MKADFSFENKYQKKMSMASSPLQKNIKEMDTDSLGLLRKKKSL